MKKRIKKREFKSESISYELNISIKSNKIESNEIKFKKSTSTIIIIIIRITS